MSNLSSHTDEWTPTPLDIPPHWEQIDFEDAFENISLSHLKIPQKEYLSFGTIPIVDQGVNLIGGFTNDASRSIRPNRALIVFGDHTRCFKLVGFRFAPGADGVKVLRPITIDERFAYYACMALRLPNRGYSRHYAFLKKSKLPLAPQNEQIRIVAKIEGLFSELDKGIESLKTARAQLNVYRQVVLKHAFEGKLTAQWREENKDKLETPEQLLARIKQEREARYEQQLKEWKVAVKEWEESGKERKKPTKPSKPIEVAPIKEALHEEMPTIAQCWVWIRLKQVGRIETGTTPSTKISGNYGGDLPFFKPTDLEQGAHVQTARFHLSEFGAESARVLPAESTLVTCIGATIGKTGFARLSCATNQQINSISPDAGFDSRFVYLQAVTPFFNAKLKSEASATTIPILNKSKFEALPFVLCPLPEQQEIVRLLEEKFMAVEQTEREIDSALAQTESLRQSILKEAFSGQLVTQDPHDEPASVLLDRIRTERENAVQNSNSKKTKKRKTTA